MVPKQQYESKNRKKRMPPNYCSQALLITQAYPRHTNSEPIQGPWNNSQQQILN